MYSILMLNFTPYNKNSKNCYIMFEYKDLRLARAYIL